MSDDVRWSWCNNKRNCKISVVAWIIQKPYPTLICRNVFFHKTDPWYQNDWGLLIYCKTLQHGQWTQMCVCMCTCVCLSGNSSIWLLKSLWYFPLFYFGVFFSSKRCSSLILSISWPSPRTSHFSKKYWFLLFKKSPETKMWSLSVCSLLLECHCV